MGGGAEGRCGATDLPFEKEKKYVGRSCVEDSEINIMVENFENFVTSFLTFLAFSFAFTFLFITDKMRIHVHV